jgi:protein CpxP
MKKLILLSTVLFVTSCVIATAAIANDNQDDPMNGRAHGFILRGIEHKLAITDAQRTQIKQILATERPAIQTLAAQVEEQRKALRVSEGAGFNEQKVRAFAAEHQQTATDVLVEREKVRSEILQVLTAEQKQKLEAMRAQWSGQFVDRLSTLGDQL